MKSICLETLRCSRRFLLRLAAAAVLTLLLAAGGVEQLLAFPYAQLGSLLRTLSLSSAAGNIAAWALLLLLGAIPAAVWLTLKKKSLTRGGDGVLLLFTPLLILVLYAMVNPGMLAEFLSLDGSALMQEAAQLALALTFDSFLLLYLALRLMHRAEHGGEDALPRGLILALQAVAAVSVFLLCASCVPAFLAAFEAEEAAFGSIVYTGDLAFMSAASFPFSDFVRFLISGGSLLADAWIALMGIYLLRLLMADRYCEEAVTAAAALAAFCRTAVTVLLTVLALFNFFTLFSLSEGGHIQLSVPVFSVAFSLLMLLISRALADRRALKQENELFI